MRVYCPYCKKEVEYKVEKRDLKEFRGIEIDTYENVAVCKECHQDLYVNEIEEKNNVQKLLYQDFMLRQSVGTLELSSFSTYSYCFKK